MVRAGARTLLCPSTLNLTAKEHRSGYRVVSTFLYFYILFFCLFVCFCFVLFWWNYSKMSKSCNQKKLRKNNWPRNILAGGAQEFGLGNSTI